MDKLYQRLVQFIIVSSFLVGMAACGAAAETPTPPPSATLPATGTTAPTASPVAAVTPTERTAATAQPELADILVILARAEGLERIVTVVENAGLTEKLEGAGPFTIFVPPTSAWDDLPPSVLANPDLMREILLAHLMEGQAFMPDMVTAGQATTLRGDELAVMAGDEGATVAGANVLGADFEANNGIIHIIDTVILPPEIATEVMALYPTVAGEQTYPMQGNIHIANGKTSPVAYNSAPPTSGPHYPNIVAWQVYEEPFRYEQLVHNLEDSGIILYYQCETACPERIQELRAVAQPYIDAGRHVVVAPNDPTWTLPDGAKPHQDMGAPITVTAWRKLLKLETVDPEKIGQFIEAFEGIDHHVK